MASGRIEALADRTSRQGGEILDDIRGLECRPHSILLGYWSLMGATAPFRAISGITSGSDRIGC